MRAFCPAPLDISVPIMRRLPPGLKVMAVSGQLGDATARFLKLATLERTATPKTKVPKARAVKGTAPADTPLAALSSVTISNVEYVPLEAWEKHGETDGTPESLAGQAKAVSKEQGAVLAGYASRHACKFSVLSLVTPTGSKVSQKVPSGLRNEQLLRELKANPGRVFGWPNEAGVVWGCVKHPRLSTAMAVRVQRAAVTNAQRLLAQAGVPCMRVQAPALSIMEWCCETSLKMVSDHDLLMVGENWGFYLPVVSTDWPKILEGRIGVDPFDYIKRLLGREGRGEHDLGLINTGVFDVEAFIRSEFPSCNVVPGVTGSDFVPAKLPDGLFPNATGNAGTLDFRALLAR